MISKAPVNKPKRMATRWKRKELEVLGGWHETRGFDGPQHRRVKKRMAEPTLKRGEDKVQQQRQQLK